MLAIYERELKSYFHSMTGFIIPSYHTNMEIDRSNSVGHPHLGVQLT